MSTCKECLHFDVCCEDWANQTEGKFTADDYKINMADKVPCDNHFKSAADFEEVRRGKWNLEVHSFYSDNWDESIELVVYILAHCSNCGKEHFPKQVFSKHLYAPEDADENFRFDQEYEKAKALEEFKRENRKLINYCSNCGAEMTKYE